jgi:hypothetical protein
LLIRAEIQLARSISVIITIIIEIGSLELIPQYVSQPPKFKKSLACNFSHIFRLSFQLRPFTIKEQLILARLDGRPDLRYGRGELPLNFTRAVTPFAIAVLLEVRVVAWHIVSVEKQGLQYGRLVVTPHRMQGRPLRESIYQGHARLADSHGSFS